MDLQIHFNRLEARLNLVEGRFTTFRSAMPARLDHTDWMFLEGLISATWQYWCHFCRSVIVHSALGAKTATGVVLPACAATWEEVSAAAVRVARGKSPIPGQVNKILRHEPTWGDTMKLLDIISNLPLANQIQLAQSFGASTYISHLQTVRNAAAHRHNQNTADVLALGPMYVVSRLRHPTEAVFWLEQQSQDLAYLFWLDDMKTIGNLAVQ